MTSREGYFLLNSFQLSADHRQLKLDDAILQAQINGKIQSQLLFLLPGNCLIIYLRLASLMTDNEQGQQSKKLKLAMAWNKYDVVNKNILANQTVADWPVR